MSENPYSVPQARLAPATAPLEVGPFDVLLSLEEGWSLTWASFPTWIGVGLVFALLSAVSVLLLVGIFLVVPVLAWGTTRFYLNVIDRRERFADLFAGFSVYGTALIAMLASYVCFFLVSFMGEALGLLGGALGSSALAVAGGLAQVAWALFVVPRLYFAAFFIVDVDMGPVEALQASWDATRGQVLRTAGLTLLTGLVLLAGALALLVGIIPAANVTALMWASAYRQMVESGPEPAAGLEAAAAPA